jgi:hypothetical protein
MIGRSEAAKLALLVLAFIVAMMVCSSLARAGTIYVRNASTVYTWNDLARDAAAINDALVYDFDPAWGTDTRLVTSPFPPAKSQVVTIVNTSKAAPDALGYHDVATGAVPYGVVMASTTLKAGAAVSSVLSHEVFEMAVDPLTFEAVKVARYTYPFYLEETADPVESESFAYSRGGVRISDFVLPNWFRVGSPGPWDFTRHVARPLQILRGGYQIAWTRTGKEVTLCPGGSLCPAGNFRAGRR